MNAWFNPDPEQTFDVITRDGEPLGRVEVYRSGWRSAWRESGERGKFDNFDAAALWVAGDSPFDVVKR